MKNEILGKLIIIGLCSLAFSALYFVISSDFLSILASEQNMLLRFEELSVILVNMGLLAVLIFAIVTISFIAEAYLMIIFMCLWGATFMVDTMNHFQNLLPIIHYSMFAMFLILVTAASADIRRVMNLLHHSVFKKDISQTLNVIEEVIKASIILANKQIGALMVIQNNVALEKVIQSRSVIDSNLSKDILVTIFTPQTPIHDGALTIIDGRIKHIGCILPLTDRQDLPAVLGTRHRSAIGISQQSDAITVVVSEETGAISISANNYLLYDIASDFMRDIIVDLLSKKITVPEIARKYNYIYY